MSLIRKSAFRFLSTPIQRDPDRWLYKKCFDYIKCLIENRQNAYSNYFASLKCQSDYNPEPPCGLNKFEKFNLDQAFKLSQQINKLFPQKSVSEQGSYIQSLIDAHRKAKIERKEYTKYIQSLDNGREFKPFEERGSIKRLDKMRKGFEADLMRKQEEILKRKKMEHEARKATRSSKQQQVQKESSEKVDLATEITADDPGKRPPSRKPKKPKK